MKKGTKIILIIFAILVFMFLTDFVCIKTIKMPIFMVKIADKENGEKEYYGIFYKAYICNTKNENKKITMGSYWLKYSCDLVEKTDSEKFSGEYEEVPIDNIFVYKTNAEIINILKHGTGLIYLGFPECPWCQAYVQMLNDIAKNNNVEQIYYLNILLDRKNNTKEYLEIVNLLKEYLNYDEEGNKRIYVPAVIAINNGEIVGFDDETSLDTKGYENPEDYWSDSAKEELEQKLTKIISKIELNTCTECNKP